MQTKSRAKARNAKATDIAAIAAISTLQADIAATDATLAAFIAATDTPDAANVESAVQRIVAEITDAPATESTDAPATESTVLAIAPAAAAASPRLTESDIQRLFAFLATTDSCPVKIGKNRGKHSSEALLAPHARVGVSPRNIGAVIFAAIAQNIAIESGALIPRFFTYADTPLHVECGAGRNVLRGRADKKSGAVTLAVTLDSCDSGDAFRVTAQHASEFALIAPGNVKAFKAALAAYA